MRLQEGKTSLELRGDQRRRQRGEEGQWWLLELRCEC